MRTLACGHGIATVSPARFDPSSTIVAGHRGTERPETLFAGCSAIATRGWRSLAVSSSLRTEGGAT